MTSNLTYASTSAASFLSAPSFELQAPSSLASLGSFQGQTILGADLGSPRKRDDRKASFVRYCCQA